jgi:hypothetical protein
MKLKSSKMIDFQTVTFSDSAEIYTIYTGPSTQELMTGLPIIHVQFAASIAYPISRLIVQNNDDTTKAYRREVLFNLSAHRGFAISVPSIGNYKLLSHSTDPVLCRSLVLNDVTTFAALTDGDTFYGDVGVTEEQVPCHPPPRTPSDYFTSAPIPATRRRLHSFFLYTVFASAR